MKRIAMEVKKLNRVSYTCEQTINGTIKDIMPLYCPVRELDWTENWDPKVAYSNSGLVEKDCIFITSHGDDDVVWIVTKLEIQVSPIREDKTRAVLTYSKTSLSEMGDKVLEGFTKEDYDIMMDSWEKAMNHYLITGEILTGLPNF